MSAKKTTKKTTAKKAAKKTVAAKKSAEVKEVEETSEPEIPEPEKEATPQVAAKPKGSVKKSAFAKKQEKKLLELRDDLMEALHGVQRDAISATETADSGNGQHQGDAGSDAYDRDLALSMLEKEKDALAEVEKALERIELGSYGICEMSGEKIPQERLEVLPFARLTMVCQQKWEAEQRTRGVHPGDYGFGAFGESSRSVSLDDSDD